MCTPPSIFFPFHPQVRSASPPPFVPIKDTSRILTKGKHNSLRILVVRSSSSREETREKGRAKQREGGREKSEKGRERERAAQDNKPGELSQVRQTREICSHISMARISIATTANCHDYKAKPTTPNQPMVANATNQTGKEGGGTGSTCWPWGLLPAIGLY